MNDLADAIYFRLLVVRCQVGDRAALEELVARCQPRLRAYVFKMLSGKPSAQDVNQEIWLDVFRDLPKLADAGAFLPWMYRIARNRVFRLLRSERWPIESIDGIDVAHNNVEPDFSTEEVKAIHDALDRISPEHREALLLRFIENMSYEQIASVAQCELGTVRSRLHNAKRALRRILENEDRR